MSGSRYTRKDILVRGGAAAGGLSLAGLLAACGAGGDGGEAAPAPEPATVTEPTGEPVRGGRLRVGIIGAGTSETLNPGNSTNDADDSRNFALFEGLTKRRPDGSGVDNNLAAELEPNADGSVWTARLNEGVVFHNGKTLTADDVIYSYRYTLDPANESLGRPLIENFIDPNKLRRIDDLTVEIGLKIPYFFLPITLTEQRVRIFPEGTTSFDTPVGTGPFKFESWTQGQRSLFVRHDQYRIHDGPYVDELEYIAINEGAARLNALQSGQIDAAIFVDRAQIGTVEGNPALQLLKGPSMGGSRFCMDVTKPPVDDVRVRQALRFLEDRQQILDTVYLGEGVIGNDLESLGDVDYAQEIPQRPYDPEQAQALLRQAGQEGLTVVLHTGEVADGIVEMATLFKEQAKAAGVTIELKNWPADQYFSGPYLKQPLFSTTWAGRPLVPQFFMATFSTAPFNETNWRRPDYDTLVLEAVSTADEAQRHELLVEIQQVLYDEGGYIIPVFPNFVDALSANVKGVVPSVFWPLGNFDWLNTFIEA
jgi:peptide/nickel transport system substrate-binding protein